MSAVFTQHSTSLHDASNRTFTLTSENDDHYIRGEHAAPRHARITLPRYAYDTQPRRARSPRGTPHHFAVLTPTILRRAERVRSAALRMTLRLISR